MYNNYGYNPYGTYMPQRPMQQPIQPLEQIRTGLNGKQVESIDIVKNIEIPLDGSTSYFPLANGSAIVSKQLQMDGTSKIVVFKPIEEQKEQIEYITKEDMEKALKNVNNDELDDIKEELKDLKQEIKELKKNNKKKDD